MLKSCVRLIDALKARVMTLEEKMQIPMSERFIKDVSTPASKSATAETTATTGQGGKQGATVRPPGGTMSDDGSASGEVLSTEAQHVALLSEVETMRTELSRHAKDYVPVDITKTREKI